MESVLGKYSHMKWLVLVCVVWFSLRDLSLIKGGEGWCKWGEGHYFLWSPKGEGYQNLGKHLRGGGGGGVTCICVHFCSLNIWKNGGTFPDTWIVWIDNNQLRKTWVVGLLIYQFVRYIFWFLIGFHSQFWAEVWNMQKVQEHQLLVNNEPSVPRWVLIF